MPWHSALSQRSNCPTLAQLLSEPRPDRAQAGSALAGTCAAPPLGGEILQGKRALLTGGERLQAPPRRRRAPGPALARQGRAGYFHARTGRRPSVGRPNARRRSRRSRSFSRLIASLGGTASAQRPAPRRPPPPQAPPGPPPGARARPGPAACAPSPSRFRHLRARAAARRRSGTGGDACEGVSRDTRDR